MRLVRTLRFVAHRNIRGGSGAGTVSTLDQAICYRGGCPVHYEVYSSLSGLHPIDASSKLPPPPTSPSRHNQKCFQIWLNVPWEAQSPPWSTSQGLAWLSHWLPSDFRKATSPGHGSPTWHSCPLKSLPALVFKKLIIVQVTRKTKCNSVIFRFCQKLKFLFSMKSAKFNG